MNNLFLIKNPEIFQGEKYLDTNKNYFEGWYFKNINKENGISFIPGININENERKAFIQVITNRESYYVNYSIEEFKFSDNPFCVKIGKNLFSKTNLHIDIDDRKQNLKINGDIKYTNSKNIKTNLFNPNIMGPFSYIPFMECNHAILCMKNKTYGKININGNKINFDEGIGYIEKDWGCSFPKNYIWCQANNFKNSKASFMLSIADIPFKAFNFRGVICDLIIEDNEYRFTTYNNSKIIKYNVNDKYLNIALKKGEYNINIKSKYDKGLNLKAPVKGKMDKYIFENINSKIDITLKKDSQIIFEDTSYNCGLEIVE
ncbi:MAG: hypothetical protein IJW20_00055 [Clostridia bacterium]|nr:hypothetical protein [Clostridia bacterium]